MKYRYHVQTATHSNVMTMKADDHKETSSSSSSGRVLVLMTSDGATIGRFIQCVAWWREALPG